MGTMTAAWVMMLTLTGSCVLAADGAGGAVKRHLNSIPRIECTEDDTLETLPPMNKTMSLSKALTVSCRPPRVSYGAALRTLEVNMASLSTLHLEFNPAFDLEPLNYTHFTGLSVKSLQIKSSGNKHIYLNVNNLEPLGTLTGLTLFRVKIRHLNTSRIGWGGCAQLERIHLLFCDILETTETSRFLDHFPRLQELRLDWAAGPRTVRRALVGAHTVTSVSMRYCKITKIHMGLLTDAVLLRKLDFSYNWIYYIDSNAFKSQSLLQELNLSNNRMQYLAPLWEAFVPLRELRLVLLENNTNLNLCEFDFFKINTNVAPKLETLSMLGTELPQYCDEKLVEVTSSPVELVANKVTILVDWSLDCDCHYGGLSRALHSQPRLSLAGALCAGGDELADTPPAQLECHKYRCANCMCRRGWSNDNVAFDCDDGAKLRIEETSIASNNTLDLLPLLSVQPIDLANNKISLDSSVAAKMLFALLEPGRRARLAGMPIACDCANRGVVEALQTHRKRIIDYEDLTCMGDRRLISHIDIDQLCLESQPRSVWLMASLLAAGVVALTVSAALCWRFERQIKVFLFARGWCLSCLREEEVDADRQYDAFVSFCHEDDEFVNEHLLPGLENYKLCIHYRDWIAGEWISTQIARSIEQSKRTIIVLSCYFLYSKWGMHEFRMAHASTLQEGRPRLVVVLVGDVLDDPQMDEELRGYLATNTYVKIGERFFWDKLRFALPHRPCGLDKTENETGSTTISPAVEESQL